MDTGINFYFVNSLVASARRENSTVKLEKLLQDAEDAMFKGGKAQMFSLLTSATIDGNTQTRQVFRDPTILMSEVSYAIKVYLKGSEASMGIERTQQL